MSHTCPYNFHTSSSFELQIDFDVPVNKTLGNAHNFQLIQWISPMDNPCSCKKTNCSCVSESNLFHWNRNNFVVYVWISCLLSRNNAYKICWQNLAYRAMQKFDTGLNCKAVIRIDQKTLSKLFHIKTDANNFVLFHTYRKL